MAVERIYPDTEWESIHIKSENGNRLEVESFSHGWVQIDSVIDYDVTISHYLDQDDLRHLLTHLQKQLK